MALGSFSTGPGRAISTEDAARILGVTRRRVLQLLAAGKLDGFKLVAGRRGIWLVNIDGDGRPSRKGKG